MGIYTLGISGTKDYPGIYFAGIQVRYLEFPRICSGDTRVSKLSGYMYSAITQIPHYIGIHSLGIPEYLGYPGIYSASTHVPRLPGYILWGYTQVARLPGSILWRYPGI